VEFESAEEGRELEVLHHLLRRATADAFRALLAGSDLTGLQGRFDQGATVETGDLVPAAELLARLGPVPGLGQLLQRLGVEQESPGLAAAALEFALEGLHLNRRLAKDEVAGRTVYGRR
jgi:magnesium chelatase subunit I